MLEVLDGGGYSAITVRALTRAAGVSTKTFYQHYSDKEECFLRSYELVAHRMLTRLASAQFDEVGVRARMRATIGAFTSELESDPRAAGLLLIDGYASGPLVLAQARETERMLVARISECLTNPPDEILVSPLIIEGIVAGLISVARARLTTGRGQDLSDLGRLSDWALSLCSRAAVQLAETSCPYPTERATSWPDSVPSSNAEPGQGAFVPTGDLALLLSAATKLVASDEQEEDLSAQRIVAAAGVSRRSFYAHFQREEECLNAALELQIDEVFTRARCSKAAGATWAEGISGAMATLCTEIDRNPVLANIYSNRVVGASSKEHLQRHEHFASEIARLLGEGAPFANRTDPLMIEASAGAILGTLRRPKELARGSVRLAGIVAFLALAPMIGADRAVEAIREAATPATRTG